VTPENVNHLIDATADVAKYLFGPLVVAVVYWVRSRFQAAQLKKETQEATALVVAKTDEQTKVLVDQGIKTQEALEKVHEATNGLTERLIESHGNEQYSKGVMDERGRNHLSSDSTKS
jgi:hypothetical protein